MNCTAAAEEQRGDSASLAAGEREREGCGDPGADEHNAFVLRQHGVCVRLAKGQPSLKPFAVAAVDVVREDVDNVPIGRFKVHLLSRSLG